MPLPLHAGAQAGEGMAGSVTAIDDQFEGDIGEFRLGTLLQRPEIARTVE
jgi:hypothetical protein